MLRGPNKARFDLIFRTGVRAKAGPIQLIALPGNGLVGFAVARKVGTRPQRNRIRRRLQAALRTHIVQLDSRCDWVIVAGADSGRLPWSDLALALKNAEHKLKDPWDEKLASS